MKYSILLITFLLLIQVPCVSAVSWFTNYKLGKAYQQKDYKTVRDVLEKEQIDSPNDAQLNYNLGTVYYKLNQINNAKNSFDRCIKNCTKEQQKLKEIASFNFGNSLYKNCLQILPRDWEKEEKIDSQLLDSAITEVQNSVVQYKNVLGLDKNNNKAKVNQKKAEDLLEKLKKKKQQQQNQQKNQKEQDKNDQQKQDQKQQNDQKSKDDSAQQQEKKDSTKKDDKNEENQKQQQEGKDRAQDGKNEENERKDDKSQDKQEAQENENIGQDSTHDKDSLQKDQQKSVQSEENGTKEEQERQAELAGGEESMSDGLKEKGFRVILDDLQSDESKMQKILIKQKSKGQKKDLTNNQKPW